MLAAAWAAQLGLRCYVLGGGGGWSGNAPWFAAADNPVSRDASLLTRTLTFFYLPAFNLGLLLWPAWLSFDWSMDAVPPISRLGDARNMATFLFYAGLAVLGVKTVKNGRMLSVIALSLLILPFLPATNLFFYVGFVVAERVLYLPSIGFCLLLGAGLEKLLTFTNVAIRDNNRSSRKVIRSAIQFWFAMALILWSLRTVQRNGDWSSEEQLYRSGIAINPAKGNNNDWVDPVTYTVRAFSCCCYTKRNTGGQLVFIDQSRRLDSDKREWNKGEHSAAPMFARHVRQVKADE